MHLYYQIISMNTTLAGGAFLQAMCKATKDAGRVYAYFFTFDLPH